MSAGEMHTGYEWLAKEKAEMSGDNPVGRIRWMEIISSNGSSADNDAAYDPTSSGNDTSSSDLLQLPLYPLGAVHIPSGHIQTLNNMQPQNIRMANDLNSDNGNLNFNGKFCVTLKAADTGRIAAIGTLMKVVSTEEQRSYDGSLLGIRVQCIAEGLVEIREIVNPQCWTKEKRLKKSDEYLVANVRQITEAYDLQSEADVVNAIYSVANRLADDFAVVRSMYACKDGVAANELPRWAVDAVQSNLPHLLAQNFTASEQSFWRAADVWQSLCNTVREARRSELQSEVNEITIDAAIKKGGMLKLPVHRTDLPQDVQVRLNRMEEEAANNYVTIGMDPVLDFQALMSTDNHIDRIRHLGEMVARERGRLEAKESLKGVFDSHGGKEKNGVADNNGNGIDPYNATTIFEGIFQ